MNITLQKGPLTKQIKVGFSWTLFFFGWIPLAFRRMWRHWLISFFLSGVVLLFPLLVISVAFWATLLIISSFGGAPDGLPLTWTLAGALILSIGLFLLSILPIFYGLKGNQLYIEQLIEGGWEPANEDSRELLLNLELAEASRRSGVLLEKGLLKKRVKVGFSWTSFFLPGCVLVFRGMWRQWLICFVLGLLLSGVQYGINTTLESLGLVASNPAIFSADYLRALFLSFLVGSALDLLLRLFYGFKGNAFYLRQLLRKGWTPADEQAREYLAQQQSGS